MRERGNERKGGRWRPQQKIVKWVSMAEERERERGGGEMMRESL